MVSNSPNLNSIQRVYIRGCPRSGNTLMLYMCRSGFKNTHILEEQEIPVKEKSVADKITFGTFPSPHTSPHRKLWAENFLDEEDAAIIFMVRDPRDVLLSDHGLKPGQPWIGDPQRWIDNAILLQNLENHPRVIPVKFEELLTKPNEVQGKIGQALGLEIAVPFSECWKHFALPSRNNLQSLKGVRPLDSSRVGNWKNDSGTRSFVAKKLQSNPRIFSLMKHLGYHSSVTTVPLLTSEAISFLKSFLEQNPNAKVLEFGSGASTVWISQYTKNLVSIEHDLIWYNKVNDLLEQSDTNHVDLKLMERPYHKVCDLFPDNFFDLVIVDGRDRVQCAESSIRVLKEGGVLILDDAQRERYQRIYNLLHSWQFTRTVSPERETNYWCKPLAAKLESSGLRWEEVIQKIPLFLYAGNLTERAKKGGWIGLSYSILDNNHIQQDLKKPIPIPDNIVDAFQSEDVFEHIEPSILLSVTFPEIYRIIKPGGMVRISVPDYRCDLLVNRSWKDEQGRPYYDPCLGGEWNEKEKRIIGNGGGPHLWLPTYEKLKALIELSPLSFCQAKWLHYYDVNGQPVMNKIDYSKGFIKRTPDNDPRVQNPRRPMSIVVDLYK